jgi:putative ABC transport system ATP-binding protein
MIKLDNISFSLPDGKKIINNFSYVISKGDFIVLLGSNGSGKSSLIKLLNKTYLPTKGNILFGHTPINEISHKKFSASVITLTQFVRDSLFMELTIQENAELIQQAYRIKRQEENLKNYLAAFNKNLTKALHTPVNQLSGGEQQILAFALYLQHQPELLLLDEHTSALDPKTAKEIMKLTAHMIKEKKITAIMATHNLEFAEQYGNKIVAIKEGKIFLDSDHSSKDQLTHQALLEACY